MYYRGANAALLVYDCTVKSSFAKAKEWVTELKANAPENIVIAIAGAKCDLCASATNQEEIAALKAEAQAYATEMKAIWGETSAKMNIGVEDIFNRITHEIVNRGSFKVDSGAVPLHTKSSWGCC
ncbi:Ras family [Pelomyxa schiedti]|nr:Ras family [Pelomyxa schiedti]